MEAMILEKYYMNQLNFILNKTNTAARCAPADFFIRPRCARPYGELRVRTRPISPTTR